MVSHFMPRKMVRQMLNLWPCLRNPLPMDRIRYIHIRTRSKKHLKSPRGVTRHRESELAVELSNRIVVEQHRAIEGNDHGITKATIRCEQERYTRNTTPQFSWLQWQNICSSQELAICLHCTTKHHKNNGVMQRSTTLREPWAVIWTLC